MSHVDQIKEYIKHHCIVITGSVATGKTTIAKIIQSLGYPVIDADQLARQVVQPGEPGLASIIKTFGKEFIHADGTLRRDLLRQTISSDSAKRTLLERLLHPLIQQAFMDQVANLRSHVHSGRSSCFFYEAALIIEAQRQNDFKEVWLADCSFNVQVERLMQRSSCSQKEAEDLIASQLPQSAKKAFASQIIDTDCSLEELTEYMRGLLKDHCS